jgi:alanine dehydrogenase
VASFEDAVRGADVVCLCTSSSQRVAQPDWLAPGAHVTSVGYMPPGGELHPELVRGGRLFVETRLAFEPTPVGCDELQGIDRRGAPNWAKWCSTRLWAAATIPS